MSVKSTHESSIARPFARPIVACFLLLASAGTGWAQDWTWQLPAAEYQLLDMFQRAAYDKAARLLNQKEYRAAAHAFEKFCSDFPDSPAIAHVVFLQAYSLHLVKDRNEAIKHYKEVLDYFPGDVNPASASIYYLARAYHDNGLADEALEWMQKMAADAQYSKHPLAAGALAYLAQQAANNGKPLQAVEYWKRIVAEFDEASRTVSDAARRSVTAHYIASRQPQQAQQWLLPQGRFNNNVRDVIDYIWSIIRHDYAWRSNDPEQEKWRLNVVTALYQYFRGWKGVYEQSGDPWAYYDHAAQLVSFCYGRSEDLRQMVDEASVFIRSLPAEGGGRDGKWAWLCDVLMQRGHFERARYCHSQMADRAWAAYKEHELLGREGQYAEAAAQCERVEKMGNAHWAYHAMAARAGLYRHHLGRYQEAIELYHKIDNPPATLWDIQDCYIRWGKLDEALKTLTTIENLFPDHAANAAWHRASHLENFGQTTRAIAEARRIMKIYPRSGPSSQAHQLLERHGVPTGGGVGDED